MTRTRVRWTRVSALLATTLLVLSLAGRALGGSSQPEPDEGGSRPHVLVEPGETLWSIARARIGPEGDPRPFIQELRDLNDLETSAIVTGQRLLLPTG